MMQRNSPSVEGMVDSEGDNKKEDDVKHVNRECSGGGYKLDDIAEQSQKWAMKVMSIGYAQ